MKNDVISAVKYLKRGKEFFCTRFKILVLIFGLISCDNVSVRVNHHIQ